MSKSASLVIFTFSKGFDQTCKVCKKVLARGNFVLGMEVLEDDNRRVKYYIGFNSSIVCCGEEKRLVVVSADRAGIEEVVRQVRNYIEEKGSTEGLLLIKCRKKPTEK